MKFFSQASLLSAICLLAITVTAPSVKAQQVQSNVQPSISYNQALPSVESLFKRSWNFTSNTKRAIQKLDRKRIGKPDVFIIHHSGGHGVTEQEKDLSAQYSITSDGKILQHFDETVQAEGTWDRSRLYERDAMGNVSDRLIYSSKNPIDLHAKQVEVVFAPQKFEKPSYRQYLALAQLIANSAINDGIKPHQIIGHSSVQTCGSKLFKDGDGDWFRFGEPHDIMYTYTTGQGCTPQIGNGLYSLVPMIRKYGAWNDGIYATMSDRQVANIIYRANFGNAAMLLRKAGSPNVAAKYERLERNLRD
jgi:N-acetyl-anhydromuramyl-L-alanine amidase AmpD